MARKPACVVERSYKKIINKRRGGRKIFTNHHTQPARFSTNNCTVNSLESTMFSTQFITRGNMQDFPQESRILLTNKSLDSDNSVDAAVGINVLLVEDDDADAYIILSALKNVPGIGEVKRARDGIEALEIIDSYQYWPDLALVDLSMPRKDGIALLAELKARVVADFPAVALTSSRAEKDVYRASKNGAWKYLTKKDRIPQMTQSLKRVVRQIRT
jgi:CheY-like chemotaxis protein